MDPYPNRRHRYGPVSEEETRREAQNMDHQNRRETLWRRRSQKQQQEEHKNLVHVFLEKCFPHFEDKPVYK